MQLQNLSGSLGMMQIVFLSLLIVAALVLCIATSRADRRYAERRGDRDVLTELSARPKAVDFFGTSRPIASCERMGAHGVVPRGKGP